MYVCRFQLAKRIPNLHTLKAVDSLSIYGQNGFHISDSLTKLHKWTQYKINWNKNQRNFKMISENNPIIIGMRI